MSLLVLVIAAIVFGSFLFAKRQDTNRRNEMERQIEALPRFSPALRFDQPDKMRSLLLDPVSEQFAVATRKTTPCLFSFDQLVAVDVERNGSSLQRTNRGSQMMGAAVGGVLLGPLGLLVGSLTGSKRQEERVKRLSLKLFTNDLYAPVTEVIFFSDPKGVKPNNTQGRAAAEQLDQWHGRFRAILLSNERSASTTAPEPNAPGSPERTAPFGRRRGLVAQG